MAAKIEKITNEGQVTIPTEIREKYGLKPGTEVLFITIDDVIIIRPVSKKIANEDASSFISFREALLKVIKEDADLLKKLAE
ncbi:MAG: AbrB/MazE/SpoVT family DNA-binding domain-containing protein [Promethearchaeota archaeon]